VYSARSGMLTPSPSLMYEQSLWEAGYQSVAGIDEAGRGALAGPVAAGAVILPCHDNLIQTLCGVRDSKLMTATARESWYEIICHTAQSCAVGFANQGEVDDLGIVPATRLAVYRAIKQLDPPPDYLITDYLILPELEYPQTGLVKGDRLVLSISAASILAKVARDRYMIAAGKSYPEFGFEQHKGYGTRQHRMAIAQLGPTPLHRLSFHPRFDDLDSDNRIIEDEG